METTDPQEGKKRKWARKVSRSFTLTDSEKLKDRKRLSRSKSSPVPVHNLTRLSTSPQASPTDLSLGLETSKRSTPGDESFAHRDLPLAVEGPEEEGLSEDVEMAVDDEGIEGAYDDDVFLHVSLKDYSSEEKCQAHVDDERHALKNLSRSTPAMSPSASPRHSDSEGPPRVSKGTKKFMRHFADAPASEWVLNYFSCALVSDILLQGTLYITPNFFAFYSKIFGHVSRLLIPVTQVAGIQKERTAKIIPNAVGLQMLDGKSYVFGSLLSRDSTYKLMLHIWKKAQRLADSDSEPPSAVQVAGEEDDGEDSVSGSAESLMEEDQTDSGYLASSPISAVTAVATGATVPWTRDTSSTTTITTTTTAILPGPDICTSSSTSIPLSNLTSSQNPVTLRQGGLSVVKGVGASIPEEPGGAAGVGDGLIQWFIQGSLVKTCFRMGRAPVKLVGEGIKELWSLPRTSLLLLISTLLLLMLFASAAFMLHRVDVLSQQLGLEKYEEYDGMYEEVLQMQQRLHAAASTEIEKTLSIQLKHIATVRQSLEALVVLFNKEPPMNTARIPDNT